MLRVRPSIVVFICPIATAILLLTSVRSWPRGISGIAITFNELLEIEGINKGSYVGSYC